MVLGCGFSFGKHDFIFKPSQIHRIHSPFAWVVAQEGVTILNHVGKQEGVKLFALEVWAEGKAACGMGDCFGAR